MKIFYFLIFLIMLNLYAFNGIDFYKNGEYQKAEDIFMEYLQETNSSVAKAYLAKIYYKEGKYKKSKKFINELLKNKSVPINIKKELKGFLLLMQGKKNIIPFVSLSEEIIYDTNVNWDMDKKEDFAHIEEFRGGGTYSNDNLKIFSYFTLQNKRYFKYSNQNYKLFNLYTYLYYYSYINTKLKLGFEREMGDSNFYTSELYFYKRFKNYEIGPFTIGEYYNNNNLNYKNLGGGIRIGFSKKNFFTKVSLMSYYSNYNKRDLDNHNFKIDIKNVLNFSKFYLYINYYFNYSKYNDYINNFHYLDFSVNGKINKYINYSIGITKYYSIINKFCYNVMKNEIYTKIICNF
ncbi:hypothetical protein LNAT_P0255 [Lebetimonas natsushimae]|uniref:Tetratricopeptide repeat protein n=1 Tax=Lebetimonas natsushimae TaxID=1936991 RepID=A0A292YC07_9BACT|nr:hypothetical protein [Lebetimonas natsushimae]GAX86960.1 hypothetical protein LNAT_P0255 [Lebetimonas natsushimae]